LQNNLQFKFKSIVGFLVGDDDSFDPQGGFSRFIRRLSLFLPLFLSIFLLGWTYIVRVPMLNESLMNNQPVIELQETVEQIRIHFSESQIQSLSEEATTTAALLVNSSAEASETLQSLKSTAAKLGLSSSISEIKQDEPSSQEIGLIQSSEYRFTLRPDKNFVSEQNDLVRVLEFTVKASEYAKRIDLVNLDVHAVDNTINTAGLNILLFHPTHHEKATQ